MPTTVLAFRPANGHYAFRERGLVTATHAHPSLEVIRAEDAGFRLRRGAGNTEAYREAIVAPGQPHAFDSEGGGCRIDLFDVELLLPGACDDDVRERLLDAVAAVRAGLAPKLAGQLERAVGTYATGDALIGQTIRRLRDSPADVAVSVAVLAKPKIRDSKAARLSESQFTRRFTAALRRNGVQGPRS